MSFWQQHTYLVASLAGLAPVLAAYLAPSRHRRMMLLSAAAAICVSPGAIVYEGEYWNPIRWGGGSFGIEDVLFCFSFGSLAWLCAVWPTGRGVEVGLHGRTFVRRFAAALCAYNAAWAALWLGGVSACTAAIVVQLALTAAILGMRRDLWPLAISSAMAYLALYCSTLFAVKAFLPNLFRLWNGSRLSGARMLGLPVEEYLSILAFAAAWSTLIAYAADARLTAPESARSFDRPEAAVAGTRG